MEIVSKPDLRSAEEAKAFVTKLRSILRTLGTCDGDMEKGNLRADVNVSVRRPGEELGTRCEIKNVNSIRFLGMAVDYEARRQIGVIEDGGKIEQETRLFDPVRNETRPMRTQGRGARLPLFPRPRPPAAGIRPGLCRPAGGVAARAAGRAEGAVRRRARPQRLRRRRAGGGEGERRLFRGRRQGTRREDRGKLGDQRAVRPSEPGREGDRREPGLLGAARRSARPDRARASISGKIAKDVFEIVWAEGGDPRAVVETRGLKQVTDTGAIEAIVDKIIAENPAKAAEVAAKPAMLGWFVGQVMKASGGKANPQAVNELLKAKLGL